jgi:archaeosine-15-forming tRNA-guanine transglycosylase
MQLQWASAALQSDRQSGDLLTMTMRGAERITALLKKPFARAAVLSPASR